MGTAAEVLRYYHTRLLRLRRDLKPDGQLSAQPGRLEVLGANVCFRPIADIRALGLESVPT